MAGETATQAQAGDSTQVEIGETGVDDVATPSTPGTTGGLEDDPFFAGEMTRTAADTAAKQQAQTAQPSPKPTRAARGQAQPAAPVAQPAAGDAAAVDPVTVLGADVVDALNEARLPVVPGEGREGALQRLYTHERGKSGRFYADFREVRDNARAANARVEQLQQLLSPMLTSYRDSQLAQQREAMAARIPDREVDPEGYKLFINEELLRRDLEREQREAQQAQLAQQQAQEEQQLASLIDVDDQALTALEESLQSDPELQQAYRFNAQMAYNNLQARYPTATHEQLAQGVELMHQLEVRGAWNAGIHPADLFKASYDNARALLGALNANGGNGNGNGHVQQPAAPAPAAPAPQPVASPTAQRMAQQSQQAAARRVVSPPPTGASPPPAGEQVDMSKWTEDEIADYVLASTANYDAWRRWQQSTYAKSSWRYGD